MVLSIAGASKDSAYRISPSVITVASVLCTKHRRYDAASCGRPIALQRALSLLEQTVATTFIVLRATSQWNPKASFSDSSRRSDHARFQRRRAVPRGAGQMKFLFGPPTSAMGPGRVETFFVPQKLQATEHDGPRRDRLSLFLLYRVWSQSGRNLGPC
jgi:hypothetical protein